LYGPVARIMVTDKSNQYLFRRFVNDAAYEALEDMRRFQKCYNFRHLLAWLKFLLLSILIALGLTAQLKST
jgi:hypothetical protein